MKLAKAHAQRSPLDHAFGALTVAQRRYLMGWSDAARAAGIDAVEDLSLRQWPDSEAETIIGVFQSGHLLASWLIVGHGGTWAVACCGDGSVSELGLRWPMPCTW